MGDHIGINRAIFRQRAVRRGTFLHMHSDLIAGSLRDGSGQICIIPCRGERDPRHIGIQNVHIRGFSCVPESNVGHPLAGSDRCAMVFRTDQRATDLGHSVGNAHLNRGRHSFYIVEEIAADFRQTVSKDDLLDFGCMNTGEVLGKLLAVSLIPRERRVVTLIAIDTRHFFVLAEIRRINGDDAILAHFGSDRSITDVGVVIQIRRQRERQATMLIRLSKRSIRNGNLAIQLYIVLRDLFEACEGVCADVGNPIIDFNRSNIVECPRCGVCRRIILHRTAALDGQRLGICVVEPEHLGRVRSSTTGTHVGMRLDGIVTRSQLIVSCGTFLNVNRVVKAAANISRHAVPTGRSILTFLYHGEVRQIGIQNIDIFSVPAAEPETNRGHIFRNDAGRSGALIADQRAADLRHTVRDAELHRPRGPVISVIEEVSAGIRDAVIPHDLFQVDKILGAAFVVLFIKGLAIGFVKPRECRIVLPIPFYSGNIGVVEQRICGIDGQRAIIRHFGSNIGRTDIGMEQLVLGLGQLLAPEFINVSGMINAILFQPIGKTAAFVEAERDQLKICCTKRTCGIFSDLHAVRNRHIGEAVQSSKSVRADIGNTGAENDFFDLIRVGIPRCVFTGVIRHHAVAAVHRGNGQGITLHHPDQFGGVTFFRSASTDSVYFFKRHIGNAACARQL